MSCLVRLPTSGSMRSGCLYARPTWGPPIGASASSSSPPGGGWQTPTCEDADGRDYTYSGGNHLRPFATLAGEARDWPTPMTVNSTSERAKTGRPTSGPLRGGPSFGLEDVALTWPTPQAEDARARGGNLGGNPMLVDEAEHWPTPRTKTSGQDSGSARRRAHGENPGLLDKAASWPTPTAGDAKQAESSVRKHVESGSVMLPDAAAIWPTPAARDGKGANSEEHCLVTGMGRKHMDQLPNFVAHRPADPAWSDLPLFRGTTATPTSPSSPPAPPTGPPGSGSSPGGPNSPPPSLRPPGDGAAPTMWKTPHGFQAGNGPDGNEFSKSVRAAESTWRTPEARDWKGPQGQAAEGTLDLPAQAEGPQVWATPMAGDAGTSTGMRPSRAATGRTTEYLHRQVNTAKKKLNPLFVSWLMSWPPPWPIARTRYGARAMASWLFRARWHAWCSLVASA